MSKRRELSSEEKAEAARLKAIYIQRKAEARSRGESLTQEIVGHRCGWESAQSAANQYLNGKVPLNLDAIINLSTVLDFKVSDVSPRLAAELEKIADRIQEPNVEPGPDIKGRVPLISWVQAGAWCEVEDLYAVGDAEEWMPCPTSHGPRTYALRVRGESMFNPHERRSFRDGDIIFVDPDRLAENGSPVIAKLDDSQEATFKQLVIEGEERYLKALNPNWPDRIIRINGNATICGVVIGKYEVF